MLFYRSLIIVATPIIILQLIISIVFFDSIWIKANKGTTRSLVGEIKTFTEFFNSYPSQIQFLSNSYKKNFDLEITVIDERLPEINNERKFSPMDRSLRRELKSVFGNNVYWFDTTKFKEKVIIKIKTNQNLIQFIFPKEKIAASSVRIFLLWMVLPSIFLIFIAIIFLKIKHVL